MNELIKLVEQWSKDKGLDQTESSKQALKFFEEAGGSECSSCTKQQIRFKRRHRRYSGNSKV